TYGRGRTPTSHNLNTPVLLLTVGRNGAESDSSDGAPASLLGGSERTVLASDPEARSSLLRPDSEGSSGFIPCPKAPSADTVG
ncbi:hypothetical protein JMJ77_0011459, partial [Colletotrichum scovillei]